MTPANTTALWIPATSALGSISVANSLQVANSASISASSGDAIVSVQTSSSGLITLRFLCLFFL